MLTPVLQFTLTTRRREARLSFTRYVLFAFFVFVLMHLTVTYLTF
jgi:hypothetical protein